MAVEEVATGESARAAADAPRGRRIAIFIYAMTGGGAQRRTLTLANGFAARGYQVDVVTVRGRGLLNDALSPQVGLVSLDANWPRWHPGIVLRKRSLKSYMAIPSLARYVATRAPDILLSAASHANIPAILAWHLAGKPAPLVLRASNHPSGNLEHRPPRHRLFKPLYNRIGGFLYARADAIVAVSKGVAAAVAELTGWPPERISTIYNPMVGAIRPADDILAPPHPWLGPGNPPVILGAGRLAVQKDFETLVRAFAVLRQQRPARLIILGDGARRPQLESLVRELHLEADVLLPGYVHDAPRWMAAADVFVLSSLWEGLPGVLIEALSTGCPIVSVDCPSGPREILDHGRYGRLVPPRAPEAMAAAIIATLDAPPIAPLLIARAAEFGCDRGIAQYLDVLDGLIARRR